MSPVPRLCGPARGSAVSGPPPGAACYPVNDFSPAAPLRPGIDPRRRKEIIIAVQLIIENLSDTTTESDLVALFSGVGRVSDVQLPTDRSTGDAKGFAYLMLASEAGAARALERLNGYELDGSEISLVDTGATTSVTEGGNPVEKVAGVKCLAQEGGRRLVEVGSGTYSFSLPL